MNNICSQIKYFVQCKGEVPQTEGDNVEGSGEARNIGSWQGGEMYQCHDGWRS